VPHRLPVLLAAAALLTAPALASSRLLVAGDEAGAPRLRLEATGARVSGAGADSRLTLPTGASIDAFASARDRWIAAGSAPVTGGRELVLWAGAGAAVSPLPAPPGRAGAIRATPVPLLRDGELVGMAWLEGEAADRFGVFASAWRGEVW